MKNKCFTLIEVVIATLILTSPPGHTCATLKEVDSPTERSAVGTNDIVNVFSSIIDKPVSLNSILMIPSLDPQEW